MGHKQKWNLKRPRVLTKNTKHTMTEVPVPVPQNLPFAVRWFLHDFQGSYQYTHNSILSERRFKKIPGKKEVYQQNRSKKGKYSGGSRGWPLTCLPLWGVGHLHNISERCGKWVKCRSLQSHDCHYAEENVSNEPGTRSSLRLLVTDLCFFVLPEFVQRSPDVIPDFFS